MSTSLATTPLINPNKNNTFCISSQALVSAVDLPGEHLVKGIIVSTVVEGVLCSDTHKFAREIREVLMLGGEVLRAVTAALHNLTPAEYGVDFKDPISGLVLRMFI